MNLIVLKFLELRKREKDRETEKKSSDLSLYFIIVVNSLVSNDKKNQIRYSEIICKWKLSKYKSFAIHIKIDQNLLRQHKMHCVSKLFSFFIQSLTDLWNYFTFNRNVTLQAFVPSYTHLNDVLGTNVCSSFTAMYIQRLL